MPFDITFHPVDPGDLQRFVFEIWREPTLAEARAAELTEDEDKRRFVIEALYRPFAGWRELAQRGELRFAPTLGFVCAAVAGYRHDYFYGGGSALSFAAERIPAFGAVTPIGALCAGARALDHTEGLLGDNYSASGIWLAAGFPALRAGLETLERERASDPALFSLFREAERAALLAALDYAEARGLALMEAADLVEPAQRRGSTDLDRLRARPPRASAEELAEGDVAVERREQLEQLFPCRRGHAGDR